MLAETALRRGETIFARPEMEVLTDIVHFFHGHTINVESSVTFQGDNGYQPIAVKVFQEKEKDEKSRTSPRMDPVRYFLKISTISSPPRADREEPRFLVTPDGGVNINTGSARFRRVGVAPAYRGRPQVRYVGSDSLSSTDIAQMWDEITLTKQEGDVAKAMKVLEEKLESLHFLTGQFTSGYFPSRGGIVVGLKDEQGRIPLGSMGDGMRRLMSLATALAFTKDGCLFVDEIDTGLHYSVMADMWNLVVTKAAASNIQVFATTHSWDCIEGISLLCQQNPELTKLVSVHKIDRALPHSVPFSGDSVVRMVKSDIDPR